MILKGNDIVTVADARPAGKPDECFYCNQPIGEQHTPECVCRKRTVMIRISYDLLIDLPVSWTKEDIEHYGNESSNCGDNQLRMLVEQAARVGCACHFQKWKVLREATKEDHLKFKFRDEVHAKEDVQ